MLTFDIILPSVGRESLKTAIRSVFTQDYSSWKLFVYEQGPHTDLSEFALNGKTRFAYWWDSQIHNDSGAWSRNAMIHYGKSEWIAYLDDDDEWLPQHLSTIAKLIENNPDVNMVRVAGQSFMMKHRHPRSSQLVRKMGPINSTDFLTVGMAHSRDLFKHTTGWQPVDNHDHLLWREMLAAGGKAVESDAVTFHFRR